ncbi:MAG: hypothetical protein SGBAC_002258 [Bacillariaceae sp.]
MSAEEEFIIEEEWVEEDFIDGESYEEEVMEEVVEEYEVKPANPLQRSTSNADFSFDGSTIVEFDLGSYNGESSSGEGEPDNYEEVCRELIKVVYPQGGSHDADDMIRRCDLKNLYKNLKQQHKFLIHSKKASAKSDGKLERWESFDDSNGAFSGEAVHQAIISFDDELDEGGKQLTLGVNDEQNWPEMEDFANPWESKDKNEMSDEFRVRSDAIIGFAPVEETQDQFMMEPQSESSEIPLIPWLERNADDPDDYEAACRELIPLVYKDEDESDPDKMLRRSDPKDLYRHLKHQHWFLVHTGAISENARSNGNSDVQISRHDKGPSLDDIWLMTERNDKMKGSMQEETEDKAIGEGKESNRDANAVDIDPLVQAMGSILKSAGQHGAEDGTNKIPVIALGKTIARINKHEDCNTEETKDEQVVKWLDRYADEPDDYAEASRKLAALLYNEDDEYDAETTLSRSSPKDLFRYLKQQHWYREHMGTPAENSMKESFYTSNTTSAETSALSQSNKLIATLKNRISRIESSSFGEMHRYPESSAASSPTSSSAAHVAIGAQVAIEPQTVQPPSSGPMQESDSRAEFGNLMQQPSLFTIEDETVVFDGMDSSNASSSLEPPQGYHSQTFVIDRKESLDRPDNVENDEIEYSHNSQNLEVSFHSDPSSVDSHERSSNDIQMDSTLRHAILDQMEKEDEAPKLDDLHQDDRETSKSDAAAIDAAVQPAIHGPRLSEHLPMHLNDGTWERDSGFENSSSELSRDLLNTEFQISKRTNETDDAGPTSSKKAKTDVFAPSDGRQRKQEKFHHGDHEQARSLQEPFNHHRDTDIMKLISEAQKYLNDVIESDAIEALKFASLQIETMKTEDEFEGPFVFLTSFAKGIIDDSVIRNASKYYRDREEFPPDCTSALKRAAMMMLDGDIDLSNIGNVVVNRERMGKEEKTTWDSIIFSSFGDEDNAEKEVFAHQDLATTTGRMNVDKDDTNKNLQVGEMQGGKASGEKTTITGRSEGEKYISPSFSSFAANALGEENANQGERTNKVSTLDRVDMVKRQTRIEEELFLIVSDAEKILGEPLSEEMLAALILAATKTAHRKQCYSLIKDAIVFLPSVAKAVLEDGLLEDASRHFGNEISAQYTAALKAASDNALDRNLDYQDLDSHSMTLDIPFPQITKEASEISPSKLESEEDIAALEPSHVDGNMASVTEEYNDANEHVSNSLNTRANKDGNKKGSSPIDLVKLEEEAKLRRTINSDTKDNLLKEYTEIDRAVNIEKERIARELDSLGHYRGLEQLRGGLQETSPEKAFLANQLKNLWENLTSAKERLEQERNRSDSAVSGGDKNIGLFGIFGVRRRAIDLEKEKEQQAKLMQQKIREMELEHSLAQIEMEIATVQQKYDMLLEQESAHAIVIGDSSPSPNKHLNTQQGNLPQHSRNVKETFVEAKDMLDERLNELEKSRGDDDSWYRREKAAIMARSETSGNGGSGEPSKLDPTVQRPVEEAHNEENKTVAASQELKIISLAASKPEQSKHLSVKRNEASQLPEDLARQQTNIAGANGEGQRIALIEYENDDISKLETTQDPASVFPDPLVGANQPAIRHSSGMDSLSTTAAFGPPSQPPTAKPVLYMAGKAKEEMMQKPHLSSLPTEEQAIEEEDTVRPEGNVSRNVLDHMRRINKSKSRSEIEALAPPDLFESCYPPRPGAAMEEKVSFKGQPESESVRIQSSETDPVMRTIANTPRGNNKKLLMLFSSTTIHRNQQTNQHRAVVVLKAKNINYESVDGSDATLVATRDALMRLSNLRGMFPQFFLVEGALISFVGTFETIEDLNDRGVLKSLVSDSEEDYRQEFMELLERDEKGESVDEDRLYHLQLYARRRVGEELSISELLDLEEFEREEAKLEKAETSHESVLQFDGFSPETAINERGLEKSSSLGSSSSSSSGSGSGSGSVINDESESRYARGEGKRSLSAALHQRKQGSPSMQGHLGEPKSNTPTANSSSDRLLSWRINGKRKVAEKIQGSVSKALAKGVGHQSEERFDSREVTNEADNFVLSKASLPDLEEIITNEKESRKEMLAAKRKQIVESRRAKWGLRSDKNADSKETNKSTDTTSLRDGTSRLLSSIDDEKRKQREAESKRLAQKTAKAREARLAREAELHKFTEQVKQKGRILNAKLDKQSSVEAQEASYSPNTQKGTPLSSNGSAHKEPLEGSLLPHMVKEVERLSGFISRYEKKLETTCKSMLPVAHKTSKEADLKRVMNLGLPDIYNYVIDQPWFKELGSEKLSQPLSASTRERGVIKLDLVAVNKPDDDMAVNSASTSDSASLKMYTLSNLGKRYIEIDGPGVGDIGRFLSALAASKGLSKQQIMERCTSNSDDNSISTNKSTTDYSSSSPPLFDDVLGITMSKSDKDSVKDGELRLFLGGFRGNIGFILGMRRPLPEVQDPHKFVDVYWHEL